MKKPPGGEATGGVPAVGSGVLPSLPHGTDTAVLGQPLREGLLQQLSQPPVLGDLQAVAQGLQRCGLLRPLLGAQPAGEAGCRVSGDCAALAPDDLGSPRSPPSPLG